MLSSSVARSQHLSFTPAFASDVIAINAGLAVRLAADHVYTAFR